jgi:hypothetical protein
LQTAQKAKARPKFAKELFSADAPKPTHHPKRQVDNFLIIFYLEN